MIVINIIFIIFILYLNYFKSNLNSSVIRRITAISFLYSGVLCLNTLYIQLIGSGVGMYSGLIEINLLFYILSLIMTQIGALLLISPSLVNLFKILNLIILLFFIIKKINLIFIILTYFFMSEHMIEK